MPTEWTYHADGIDTAVETKHDLDGSLTSVTIQLDTFRVRRYDVDEVTEEEVGRKNLYYNEEKDLYEEHGSGANATLRFSVSDGVAGTPSITPEDGDTVEPRHFALFRAARRVVSRVPGVDDMVPPTDEYFDAYENAEGVHIDAIDN